MEASAPPTTVLVTSTRDEASTTIAKGLVKNHPFESTKIMFMGMPLLQYGHLLLATVDTELVEPPDLDAYFNPSAYVFLCRHRAESKIPVADGAHHRKFHGHTLSWRKAEERSAG